MRKFTFSDAKSHKFWNIDLKGKSFTVTFGRQGSKGQTQTKTFPDEAKARKEHDKLIKEKLAKGYTETTPAQPAKPRDATREALEAALAANPDDLAAHTAYADYLTEQGDPLGDFIQVQLALEDPGRSSADRKKLRRREQELQEAHQRQWLGEIADYLIDGRNDSRCEFRLARGWLDQLHVGRLTVEFARALTRAPRTRLLRELAIDYAAAEDENNDYEPGDDVPDWEHDRVQFISLHPLVRSPHLGNVRRFRLGEDVGDDYRHYSSYTLGIAAVDLIRKMPRLEEIRLFTRGVDMDRLFTLRSLPQLRVLQVYHMNRPYPLKKLSANPAFPNLTHLLFHPHYTVDYFPSEIEPEEHEDASYINLKAARALFKSPHLQKLTHLQLRVSSMGDRGCEELVRSGLLRRLKVLDLRHGRITDEGARTLAGCPDLKRLEHLDLDRNALTAEGVALLKSLKISVRADSQQTEDEARYGEYLGEGDFE